MTEGHWSNLGFGGSMGRGFKDSVSLDFLLFTKNNKMWRFKTPLNDMSVSICESDLIVEILVGLSR